jgi:cytochrome P450
MTLLFLINTPHALNALKKEMDDAIDAGKVSSPITDAEARQLPYLQAVIKEGLRYYPPQTALNYKQVPAGGAEIHGFRLPAGTQVGVSIQHITWDRALFGPDVDVFRPERWLEAEAADEERYREMVAALDLIFGTGKYTCLGKTIAAMELNKVLVEVSEVPRHAPFYSLPPSSCAETWDGAPSNSPLRRPSLPSPLGHSPLAIPDSRMCEAVG